MTLMKMRKLSKPGRTQILCKMAVVIGALLFLLWRAPYGYCFNDEAFYLTLAERLNAGDHLIFDEWHLAQLFSPLLLPVNKLFHVFHESNEGILLFFRYAYAVIWFGVCLLTMELLNRTVIGEEDCNRANYYRIRNLCTFLFLILFTPFDIMALSYNSIGLMACLCMSLACYAFINGVIKNVWMEVFLIGICSAVLVLCTPFFAIAYFGLVLTSICLEKRGYLSKDLANVFVKSLLVTSVLAVIYCLLFVYNGSFELSRFLQSIQAVLQDPEHSYTSLGYKIISFVMSLVRQSYLFAITLLIVLFAVIFLKDIAKRYKLILFAMCSAGFLLAQIKYLTATFSWGFNHQMINIAMLGFAAYLLTENKNRGLFVSYYLLGMLYTIFLFYSSNLASRAIGIGFVVCGVGGIIAIFSLIEEIYLATPKCRMQVGALLIIILIAQLGVQVYTRINRQYFDAPPMQMDAKIEAGAAAGLITTTDRKAEYEKTYNGVRELYRLAGINPGKDNTFFSLISNPVLYLDSQSKNGSFSAWTFGYENDEALLGRLKQYCEITDKDYPQIVICEDVQKDVVQAFLGEEYLEYGYEGLSLFLKRSSYG